MPASTDERPQHVGLDRRHEPPRASDRCDLWLTLRTRGTGAASRVGLSSDEPPIFLHLRSSGLLLALPDEDPALLDSERSTVTIRLHVADALGLGLAPSDFADGVGICGGAEDGTVAGWRCRDASLVGLDADGREWPLPTPTEVRSWLA